MTFKRLYWCMPIQKKHSVKSKKLEGAIPFTRKEVLSTDFKEKIDRANSI